MNRKYRLLGAIFTLGIIAFIANHLFFSEKVSDPKFSIIPLGTAGGITQQDLSSYLLAPKGKDAFVCLDAGTGLNGIRKAYENGCFKGISIPKSPGLLPEVWLLKNNIRSYLISHPHLDHLTGLVLNSTEDTPKTIMGLSPTINQIKNHVFNAVVWPNFGNEGSGIKIKTYKYIRTNPGTEYQIPETSMRVTPFPLSHAGVVSTAFLIRHDEFYILYFGDTGPDKVEKGDNMKRIWKKIAPLVKEKKLRGIFLESSYPDPHPEKLLFGHLTPSWIMNELNVLANLVNPEKPRKALSGLTVMVTHIKPSVKKGVSAKDQIKNQLKKLNNLKVRFVFPEQGELIGL